MTSIDLETAAAAEVYEAVATMDEDEFERLMEQPPQRERIIDALVEHMVELFDAEQAEGLEARIHLKLWDRPEGGYEHFELRIADGACELGEPGDDPDLTLKVRPTDLRKLLTGETGSKRLAFKGRLRAIGDIKLGMKLPDLFGF